MYYRWVEDPGSVPLKELNSILREFEETLQKLALAQKQPCVFESSIELQGIVNEPFPACRLLIRLLHWRAEQNLRNDAIDAACHDVASALRMKRDIRSRGAVLRQSLGMLADATPLSTTVPRILNAPDLTISHCDQLLDIVTRHEQDGPNPLNEGFRAEYLHLRHHIHRLQFDLKLRDELELNDSLADFTDADFAAEVAALNRYFRPLFDRGQRSDRNLDQLLPEQETALRSMRILTGEWEPKVLWLVAPRRHQLTRIGAVRCLIAVRRWQLEHDGTNPPDLLAACRAAAIPEIPIDEYSPTGERMRYAQRDGRFVVYSVGPDQTDDGAEVEWHAGPPEAKGDWIFRAL